MAARVRTLMESLNAQKGHVAQTYTYVVKSVSILEQKLFLTDGSSWSMESENVGRWEPGHHVTITFDPSGEQPRMRFANLAIGASLCGTLEKKPKAHVSRSILRNRATLHPEALVSTLVLDDGAIFRGPKVVWETHEPVSVYHAKGAYLLWNSKRDEALAGWEWIGNEKEGSAQSLLNIQSHLDERVIGQGEASEQICSTLFRCWAGLSDPELPVGVFLFLGPSGVGKTEMAKALAQLIFHDEEALIRLDMSHFTTAHDHTRLLGPPPGIVGHADGGQLTEALKERPRSIVLLDEIEKADPAIRKSFLSIFDEGAIYDAQGERVACNQALFILTGNICAQEIATLYNHGCTTQEVAEKIESVVMARLSPELYNRLTTLVFRPITDELITHIVDQKLARIQERIKASRRIDLVIENSAKEYLITHGYHPDLGVRPLNRLIENKMVGALALAIITDGVADGATLSIAYNAADEQWDVRAVLKSAVPSGDKTTPDTL